MTDKTYTQLLDEAMHELYKAKLKVCVSQTDHFGSLGRLSGLQIIKRPPPPLVPKLKLSHKVQVSAKFREEFDQLLMDRFGFKEDVLKDQVFMTHDQLIVPHNFDFNSIGECI